MLLIPLFSIVTCLAPDAPRPASYVYFNRDHDRVADTAFLDNPGIAGAQLTFTWRELEPRRDVYNFDEVRKAYDVLRQHGKRMFLQIQDVSFSDRILVPEYLISDTSFHGGAARQFEGPDSAHAHFVGWVARRFDPAVRERVLRLIAALGREFDGKLEGVNTAETSVGFQYQPPAGFTPANYASGIREIMSGMRRAFPHSCVIVYGNFMPGEWLPDEDHGYLRSVYAHADSIGAGVGGPDLLPHRRGQQNHSLRLIAARRAGTIAGLAVQDGNLAEKNPETGAPVTVDELYRFAKERLRLDYIFWGTEEPYYSRDVLPYLRRLSEGR